MFKQATRVENAVSISGWSGDWDCICYELPVMLTQVMQATFGSKGVDHKYEVTLSTPSPDVLCPIQHNAL